MEKKIIKYEILSVLDSSSDSQINDYIAKGYQPYGSPCCCMNKEGDIVAFQAMVKYED